MLILSLFRIKSLNCSFGGFGTEALKEQWMDLLEFSHDGVAINDSDTAGSLNMEDFTLVKVVSRRPTPELTLQERQLFQLSQDISATLHQEVRTARASGNLVSQCCVAYQGFEDVTFVLSEEVELKANRTVCAARSSHLKVHTPV